MRNFEITKREVLASISIIAVMILVGILISAKITERQMDRNEVYNKALHMNPGAAGKSGFHQVRTLLRFVIAGKDIKDLEVIELGNRAL